MQQGHPQQRRLGHQPRRCHDRKHASIVGAFPLVAGSKAAAFVVTLPPRRLHRTCNRQAFDRLRPGHRGRTRRRVSRAVAIAARSPSRQLQRHSSVGGPQPGDAVSFFLCHHYWGHTRARAGFSTASGPGGCRPTARAPIGSSSCRPSSFTAGSIPAANGGCTASGSSAPRWAICSAPTSPRAAPARPRDRLCRGIRRHPAYCRFTSAHAAKILLWPNFGPRIAPITRIKAGIVRTIRAIFEIRGKNLVCPPLIATAAAGEGPVSFQ